eukprot:TRINITY_DN1511_c0_g1_i1.p1 TRINITY_DN1511_c0_g1~~TRINITY_DN1511_c0_g1_i1.p1  ORF type:complete len:370 (+),score=76.57 TRINITY_DN1511_c0_g1_i1:717-1826(+)
MRPEEDVESWFSLLVLHQNRIAHSPKNYIHETFIESFMHLIVWGHEHECLISPQQSAVSDFFITQPGSSVATSLSEHESRKKHVGILEICQSSFRMRAVPLQTVRPFIMQDVEITEELINTKDQNTVVEFLSSKVDEMINKAQEEYPQAITKLPLIRLRVEYSGFSPPNPQRFGQRFVGRVANPTEILLFQKKKAKAKATAKKDDEEGLKTLKPPQMEETSVEELIKSFLDCDDLDLLHQDEFNTAIHHLVEKDEKSAIVDYVQGMLSKAQKFLIDQDPLATSKPEEIEKLLVKKSASLSGPKKMNQSPSNLNEDEDDHKNENGNGDVFLDKPGFDDDELFRNGTPRPNTRLKVKSEPAKDDFLTISRL